MSLFGSGIYIRDQKNALDFCHVCVVDVVLESLESR